MTIRKETASTLVLALVGAGFLLYTLQYPLDTLENPGPGIFPLVAGAVFTVLAGWQLLQSIRISAGHGDKETIRISVESAMVFLKEHEGEKRILVMIGVLVFYLLLMQWIGFFVSTFLFVIIASRLSGARDWLRPAALSVGVSLFSYLLFAFWLKMSLPRGIFF